MKKQLVNNQDEDDTNTELSSTISSINTQSMQNITYVEEHLDLLSGNTKQNVLENITKIIDKLTLNEEPQQKIEKLTLLYEELLTKINNEKPILSNQIQTESQETILNDMVQILNLIQIITN